MCTISFVGDHYRDRWPEVYPWIPQPGIQPIPVVPEPPVGVSREEFDALRREVKRMKELLKMAKQIDEETGQADCEIEDKVALLRRVADIFGISLDDVIGPAPEVSDE